jgi:hypothetical protein
LRGPASCCRGDTTTAFRGAIEARCRLCVRGSLATRSAVSTHFDWRGARLSTIRSSDGSRIGTSTTRSTSTRCRKSFRLSVCKRVALIVLIDSCCWWSWRNQCRGASFLTHNRCLLVLSCCVPTPFPAGRTGMTRYTLARGLTTVMCCSAQKMVRMCVWGCVCGGGGGEGVRVGVRLCCVYWG